MPSLRGMPINGIVGSASRGTSWRTFPCCSLEAGTYLPCWVCSCQGGNCRRFQLNGGKILKDPALRTGIIEACCVPAVRKLYVHTDGELSICERIGSSPSVGTISTGVNKEVVLKKYIDDYLAASKPLCENCWAYNICPMCYSECYSQNGVNIKEKSSKCKNCRTYTYLMLGTFCTLMEERPEIMETLNHTVSV